MLAFKRAASRTRPQTMKRKKIDCAVCGSDRSELLVVARGNRGLNYIAAEHPVVICLDCGLVYLNPQHSAEDYESYYALEDYKPIKTAPDVFLRRHIYRRIRISYRNGSYSASEVAC